MASIIILYRTIFCREERMSLATVKPFKGLLYQREKIDQIANVVCPPYDVISPEEQDNFYRLSPYNIIRAELGKSNPTDNDKNNVYKRARTYLESWINEGVLQYDDEPSFYLYIQQFTYDGKNYLRPGIIAAVQLEDYEAKVILPHEKTLPKAKDDRLKLLRETETNISQIFGFFSDTTRKARLLINETLKSELPLYEFSDPDGTKHSLYRIPSKFNTDVFDALYEVQIFIADGHHRYETALIYRNEMREKYGYIEDAWYEAVMMTLVPLESNLLILPIHRILKLDMEITEKELIKVLSVYFNLKPVPGSAHLKEGLDSTTAPGVFGLITPANSYLITVKPEALNLLDKKMPEALRLLDANILSEIVFKNILRIDEINLEKKIVFTSDFREAVETPKRQKNTLSFILRPVSVETIKAVSLAGMTMPQKTTYFYPKLWTGLVMRSNIRI
jgi:uncharacterized protein (DUF1015 family)